MSKIKVDIFHLADATGSMHRAIHDVQKNIVFASTTLAEENDWDVGVGVATYRDATDGDYGIFDNILGITNEFKDLKPAVDGISARGGGDTLEAQMYALYRLAKQVTISGWRSDSYRYIAWYGDEGGHDPLLYRGVNYTLAKARRELISKNIRVMAFNTKTSSSGLNFRDQAIHITDATGGDYLSSVDPDEITRVMYDTIQEHLRYDIR